MTGRIIVFISFWSNLIFGQSTIVFNYDTNGNRLVKKQQGSSPNPTVVVVPTAVSLNQACTVTATGCPGTVRWSTGQQGASISVTPMVTTQYMASCVAANCPTNGIGQATVEVYQCQPDAIGITSTLYSVRYGQTITLTAYGCPGTVLWSTGQTGFTMTTQVYSSSNTFAAYCSKRNCTNTSTGSIQITGQSGCLSGDVMVTAKAGNWQDASTWVCNRIPTFNDDVYLAHVITVDRVVGKAKTLTLGAGYVNHLNGGSICFQSSVCP